MAYRQLKKRIEALLCAEDLQSGRAELESLPPRQAVNPLFALFFHPDRLIAWRAASAMGIVVAGLACEDMESARVVMRRLMWNLNDESGGIGWGSPQAMGDILARHERLATEYASILVSYIQPSGNYLENEDLRQGALWGIGRMARVRPGLAMRAATPLAAELNSTNPGLRGMAVWAAAALAAPELTPVLRSLSGDQHRIHLYRDDRLVDISIAELVREAL